MPDVLFVSEVDLDVGQVDDKALEPAPTESALTHFPLPLRCPLPLVLTVGVV